MPKLNIVLYYSTKECTSCDKIKRKYDKIAKNYAPYNVFFKKQDITGFKDQYGFDSLPVIEIYDRESLSTALLTTIDKNVTTKNIEQALEALGQNRSNWRYFLNNYWSLLLILLLIGLYLKFK